jgi:hypothetical protein
MEVDDDCLSLAGQKFSGTLNLDQDLQTNPSASSRFTSNRLGRYTPPACTSLTRDTTLDDTRFLRKTRAGKISPLHIQKFTDGEK